MILQQNIPDLDLADIWPDLVFAFSNYIFPLLTTSVVFYNQNTIQVMHYVITTHNYFCPVPVIAISTFLPGKIRVKVFCICRNPIIKDSTLLLFLIQAVGSPNSLPGEYRDFRASCVFQDYWYIS